LGDVEVAILRMDEIRRMTPEELEKKLKELKIELIHARMRVATARGEVDTKRVRELRRAIARINTVLREYKFRKIGA